MLSGMKTGSARCADAMDGGTLRQSDAESCTAEGINDLSLLLRAEFRQLLSKRANGLRNAGLRRGSNEIHDFGLHTVLVSCGRVIDEIDEVADETERGFAIPGG